MDDVGASSGGPLRQDGPSPDRPAGLLDPYLAAGSLTWAGDPINLLPEGAETLLAACRLQDIPDYRAALQGWFATVRTGGRLIVTVPNAFLRERHLALPADGHPGQKRLYSHAQLMMEVEEALLPASYRVLLLCDDGGAGDAAGLDRAGTIALVLEKLATADPAPLEEAPPPPPPFAPARTRAERALPRKRSRILILKLDHLGDFVLGLPAIERARALFAEAHITLVVGSWNLDLAHSLSVADEVIAFDAFPRNSSEEEVDVPGKRGLFDAAVPDSYDLAIDLRTDGDTRTLLARVRSAVKAGLGDRSHHPFLDIALPIDPDRGWREQAREERFDHHAFASQDGVQRLYHRLVVEADRVHRGSAIIWGPYNRLRPGRYVFDPSIELTEGSEGLLMIDVALNARRVARRYVERGDPLWLQFDVDQPDSAFEFRIWALEEVPPIGLSFYGGRLRREGVAGSLHQSDYLVLLIELVARRMDRLGLLVDRAE